MRFSFAFVFCAVACSSSPNVPDASSFEGGSDSSAPLHANGTVGAWQTLAPMPNARANFCAAVVGSFVVVIGGNFPSDGGFTKLDDITVARFHDDGSLDPWQLAGHAPSPVTECTATALNNTLFLMDGIYDDASKEGQVFVANLSDQGTLEPFSSGTALPAGTDLFDDIAFANPDELYAATSQLSGTCDLSSTGLHGGQLPSGTASWTDTPFVSEFRGRPQWATATAGGATYVYVLGGYSDADAGNAVLTSGWGTRVVNGTPFAATALPTPTTFGTAAWADDFVFVIGGRTAVFSGPPEATVISAQASATDGTLSAWTAQPPLPAGRTNVSAVVAGNFLYVLGGAGTAATDTVYAAQVRF